ncbi:uncharacterized protein LOC127797922 isoform X2 [Diospyros lotus]|nr:uncharacterized protein LOC127797922 isoform X2 [Diospyros lotus]
MKCSRMEREVYSHRGLKETIKKRIPGLTMNRGVVGRKISAAPVNGRRNRDEDLLLFREMHRREKDSVVSLLQPVSEEFEANGTYPLHKTGSAKKGWGYDLFAESGKNDYDWLKTPPATPLFPSLETEVNAPELAVQREIPIIQPLSRFSGNSATNKASSERGKYPKPKSKAPLRSVTPGERPILSALHNKSTGSKSISSQLKITNQSSTDHFGRRPSVDLTAVKAMNQQKESTQNLLITSNSSLSKSIGSMDSKPKPKSRGVSPRPVRSTVAAQIPGFPDETPPNLRTDRSSSTSRGRSGNPNVPSVQQKTELNPKTRRQSCSPSVTRGRKVEPKQEVTTTSERGKIQTGNGKQILGSRMVDRLMNARKTSAEERETKTRLRGSINENPGFGRLAAKSSVNMALKHIGR